MASYNRTLGKFDLVGLPAAPRGVPQVEVTFDIDANGIVHVSAKDLATGKEQKIKIESSSGLSSEEVDQAIKEAEEHADDDKKKHESVQARNNLDNLIYQTEKTLKEHGDKATDDERQKIEEAVKEAKEALQTEDVEVMNKAVEKLSQASHGLAQKMYEESAKNQQQPGAEAQGNPSAQAQTATDAKEDVVDADFEVMDEDKDKDKDKDQNK